VIESRVACPYPPDNQAPRYPARAQHPKAKMKGMAQNNHSD
jgi:hypothetical protein